MSAVKRVRFEDQCKDEVRCGNPEEEEEEEEEKPDAGAFGKKFKHSLDSDEEDDEVIYEKEHSMHPEEIDGEEAGINRVEGEVKFTAFNMKEEMQEGHFTKDGSYIYRKDQDEMNDAWVQNVDTCEIADVSKIRAQVDSEDSQDVEPVDTTATYKQMLTLMEKGETVGKAMRRLGAAIKDMRTRNRKEKKPEIKESMSLVSGKLDKLTELSGLLVTSQDLDIFEKRYEQIESLVIEKEKSVDMFGADN